MHPQNFNVCNLYNHTSNKMLPGYKSFTMLIYMIIVAAFVVCEQTAFIKKLSLY